MKIGRVFVLTLLVIFLLGLGQAYSQEKASAPSFESQDLDGKKVSFDAQKLKKPVLLVFWASWCQSCKYETPQIVKLYQDKQDHLDILGVSVDKSQEKALKYFTENKIPYPNLYDPKIEVSKKFRVRATPTLILVDAQGQIAYRSYRLNPETLTAIENSLK
jgi:thiol-disulfide isomerase/thioredoxin